MSDHRSLEAVRRGLVQTLSGAGIEDAGIEATLLIERITGQDRTTQIIESKAAVSLEHQNALTSLVSRRLAGEPIDNILGTRGFYGLDFIVSPHVLTPRPETELIVDFVLSHTHSESELRILDLGTGSAAIPIAIMKNRPGIRGLGVDISEKALSIARKNARVHRVLHRLDLSASNWFDCITGRFDFVMSNPPYIASNEVPNLSKEVRNFDPALALDGGVDGLMAYREIAKSAAEFLNLNGYLVLEIGYDQGASVLQILENHGFVDIELHQDLSGQDRMVTARLST